MSISSRIARLRGKDAGVDRLGDRGQRHAELERGLGRPAAGPLLLRFIEDDVDQRLARACVGLAQDGRGDLDQIAVEIALFPGLEDLGHRRRVEAVHALHQIVGFGDQLHVGIFDAVVHHLHIVAGALRADVGAAGHAIDLGRHLGQHRRDPVPGFAVAAGHHAGALERAFLAAGNAHADEADLFRFASLVAARGVGEQRVAAVDDDVVLLEMGQELVDHLVDRRARLDHDEDRAGLGDAGDKLGERLGREKAAFTAVLGDELIGPLMVAVENRDAEPMPRRVSRQIGAHDGQSEDADVSLISQGCLPRGTGEAHVLAFQRRASKSPFGREAHDHLLGHEIIST